jgi:molybdopterin-containing oxidoreductase family iron-sulfur binding subunit
MVIDLKRCSGCKTCSVVCKVANNIPNDIIWNRVLTEGGNAPDTAGGTWDNPEMQHWPVACQHCQNAACQRVCPTGATYKDDKGRVEIDYDKCIGCRMCMAACPYNARNFNWQTPVRVTGANYGDAEVPVRPKGVAEKCTLCRERTDRGEEPMCVVCCPTHARIFGDLDDPASEVSKAVVERKAHVLLEEQGTRPQVYYFD